MSNPSILILPGDGIGAEVAAQAERVLQAVAKRYGFEAEVARRIAELSDPEESP